MLQVKCYGKCLKTMSLSQLQAYHATIEQGEDIILVNTKSLLPILKKQLTQQLSSEHCIFSSCEE